MTWNCAGTEAGEKPPNGEKLSEKNIIVSVATNTIDWATVEPFAAVKSIEESVTVRNPVENGVSLIRVHLVVVGTIS